MAGIGEWARLRIVRESKHGLLLDAGAELGEVLLPRREVPDSWSAGGELDVFLYHDSEDRPIATTRRPKAMPGEFALLKVLEVTPVGAFLDWGLPKDLLLPFGEKKVHLEAGRSYVVRVALDPESGRLIASQRLGRYLSRDRPRYVEGEEVDLLLYARTDLGYSAIVDGRHRGLLYANEVFRPLRPGERTKGYIREIRPDGKIDLSLYPIGREAIGDLESRIEGELRRRGGSWHLCDSSPAEEIHRELGVSKKAFKQATGALFRRRRIVIDDDGIRLVERDGDGW